MHNSLVILAGGASSRMKKPTDNKNLTDEELAQANARSKGLIGVGLNGRPMMDYLLYNAKRAGFEQVYILINENGALFKEFYGNSTTNNQFHGLNISFAIQYIPEGRSRPFGTADALYQAVTQFPELNNTYYTVCNSDNLYSTEAMRALREYQSENAFINYSRDALDFPAERISRFALTKVGEENDLIDIIEKPSPTEAEKYCDALGKLRVSMNIFKFNGTMMFNYLKNCPINADRNEKELPTALLNMIQDNPKSVIGLPFAEHVPDLTAKEDIVVVKEYLSKHYGDIKWDTSTINS